MGCDGQSRLARHAYPRSLWGQGLDTSPSALCLSNLGGTNSEPLFASALVGASAVIQAGNEAQKTAILPKVADGSAILSLALEEGARHSPENTALTVKRSDSGYVLSGKKTFVMEGMAASHFVVVGRSSGPMGSLDGLSLFLVEASTEGLTRSQLATMDARGYANLSFDDVAVSGDALMGEEGAASSHLGLILDIARAGLAMEMLGTAGYAFEMTLDYLKTRKQFGQVIDLFKHWVIELRACTPKWSCREAVSRQRCKHWIQDLTIGKVWLHYRKQKPGPSCMTCPIS